MKVAVQLCLGWWCRFSAAAAAVFDSENMCCVLCCVVAVSDHGGGQRQRETESLAESLPLLQVSSFAQAWSRRRSCSCRLHRHQALHSPLPSFLPSFLLSLSFHSLRSNDWMESWWWWWWWWQRQVHTLHLLRERERGTRSAVQAGRQTGRPNHVVRWSWLW